MLSDSFFLPPIPGFSFIFLRRVPMHFPGSVSFFIIRVIAVLIGRGRRNRAASEQFCSLKTATRVAPSNEPPHGLRVANEPGPSFNGPTSALHGATSRIRSRRAPNGPPTGQPGLPGPAIYRNLGDFFGGKRDIFCALRLVAIWAIFFILSAILGDFLL